MKQNEEIKLKKKNQKFQQYLTYKFSNKSNINEKPFNKIYKKKK